MDKSLNFIRDTTSRTSIFERMFRVDVRSLALFRIALAMFILFDIFFRLFDTTVFYTDIGVYPRSLFFQENSPWVVSLHLINGAWGWQVFLFFLGAVAACMLAIGYRTRVASVASWIFVVSLHARNPLILQGGDTLLRMLLFWSMFLPLGAYYSLDRARDLKTKYSRFIYSPATIALILQVALMYWVSVAYKFQDSAWLGGDAVSRALHILHLHSGIGYMLLMFPGLLFYVTYAVLVFEVLGPLFLLLPLFLERFRLWIIAGFFALHLAFALTLAVGPFPWIASIAMLPFLPSYFWELIISHIPKRRGERIAMYYDGECGFCRTAMHAFKSFFLLSGAKILPAIENESVLRLMQERNSWVIMDEKGLFYTRYEGFMVLLRASPLYASAADFFAWKYFQIIGEKIYRFIAGHRTRVCEIESPEVSFSRCASFLSLFSRLLVILFFLFVVWWNAKDFLHTASSPLTNIIADSLGLRQRWNMFTQLPKNEINGWGVVAGTFADGSYINFLTGEHIYVREKLFSALPYYKNERWRKFMEHLHPQGKKEYQYALARYFCNEYKQSGAEKLLTSVGLYYISARMIETGEVVDMSIRTMMHVQCKKSYTRKQVSKGACG